MQPLLLDGTLIMRGWSLMQRPVDLNARATTPTKNCPMISGVVRHIKVQIAPGISSNNEGIAMFFLHPGSTRKQRRCQGGGRNQDPAIATSACIGQLSAEPCEYLSSNIAHAPAKSGAPKLTNQREFDNYIVPHLPQKCRLPSGAAD